MNRPLTALFAALEALLVVGVGIGIPLVPLTLMWAFQYGLQVDYVVFWRGAVDVWLLGHGTDIAFVLDPLVAASTGFAAAGETILLTIAPLGFALITLLLAVRAGRRIGETEHRHIGHLVAIVAFAVLSLGITLTALHPAATPSIAQGAVLPTLVFALGIALGSEVSRRRDRPATPRAVPSRVVAWIDDRQRKLRPAATLALTGGAAASGIVLAVSALAVAALVAVSYGQIIAIYEGVQAGILGGAALTVAQLALLPNLVIWAASWFVGPGFAIGTGSTVGPLGTVLGPVPAVPVLGALPTGETAFGFVGLLVPVLAGFLAAVVLRPRLVRAGLTSYGALIGTGLGMGVAGGTLLGALAWVSAGSAGPGRLEDVGASWLLVGGFSALEIGVPAAIALLVGSLRAGDVAARPPSWSRWPEDTGSSVHSGAGLPDSTGSDLAGHDGARHDDAGHDGARHDDAGHDGARQDESSTPEAAPADTGAADTGAADTSAADDEPGETRATEPADTSAAAEPTTANRAARFLTKLKSAGGDDARRGGATGWRTGPAAALPTPPAAEPDAVTEEIAIVRPKP